MSFDSLGLHEALTKAVADSGYDTATEVQTQAIPPAIAGADGVREAWVGDVLDADPAVALRNEVPLP